MNLNSPNIQKLFTLADKLTAMGFELTDEHSVISTIEDNHLDTSKFDFPEGSFNAFKQAVSNGLYNTQEILDQMTQDLEEDSVLTDEEIIDGVARGTMSLQARPDDPIWQQIEERRKQYE